VILLLRLALVTGRTAIGARSGELWARAGA
jgi:hypothetical protein